MYLFLKNSEVKKTAIREIPSFASSLILAELAYKFGSFTLECIAFLVTWFVFDWVLYRAFYNDTKEVTSLETK